ncbi:MAG TPA: FkbM family methyltransferase [Longimicrobium sp.]|nr:FkbM family methyltransferase [Longimicrobium sp.]
MTLAHSIRKTLRRAGIDARRANPFTNWELRLPTLLRQHGVKTVLDVGANDGGYASGLLDGGFGGRIVSFEPLPEAWRALSEKARASASWEVAPPVALSDENGETVFHQAGNSVSSSLLVMTEAHSEAAPRSGTVASLRVRTRRLDDVLGELDAPRPLFLKLDVQGAEHLVLKGAGDALRTAVVGVQLEMSLARLYEGQMDAAALDALLRSFGFECWDIIPGFRDPRTLRMLQYDGIYFRSA